MYLKAYTADEIGEAVGLSQESIKKDYLSVLSEDLPKVPKVKFSESGNPCCARTCIKTEKFSTWEEFKQSADVSSLVEIHVVLKPALKRFWV